MFLKHLGQQQCVHSGQFGTIAGEYLHIALPALKKKNTMKMINIPGVYIVHFMNSLPLTKPLHLFCFLRTQRRWKGRVYIKLRFDTFFPLFPSSFSIFFFPTPSFFSHAYYRILFNILKHIPELSY